MVEQQEPGFWTRGATALAAGGLGTMIGVALLVFAVGLVWWMRTTAGDQTIAAVIVGLSGLGYLFGGVQLLRRRNAGRRVLLVVSGLMGGASLLVVLVNGIGHGWTFGPFGGWAALNAVLLALALAEPTRRWVGAR
ncbi:hypothetical protein ACWEQ0_00645 [Nocardia thailandica]